MYFHMAITSYLFELQRWSRYENDSFFYELFEKQHRVTPKRNKSNKNNTWDHACLSWPNVPKPILCIRLQSSSRSTSSIIYALKINKLSQYLNFVVIRFLIWPLKKIFLRGGFSCILGILRAYFEPKIAKIPSNIYMWVLTQIKFLYWKSIDFYLFFRKTLKNMFWTQLLYL